jgi:hypothetical protein
MNQIFVAKVIVISHIIKGVLSFKAIVLSWRIGVDLLI